MATPRIQLPESIAELCRRWRISEFSLSALKRLGNTSPWDWPGDTGTALIEVLRDRGADEKERILEASVRAPLDWHPDAIRVAHASNDEA